MRSSTARRIYLREAAFLIFVARLAVRYLSPTLLFAWANQSPERICRFRVHEIDRISWAIQTIAAKRNIDGLSLPIALAAQYMLRRRGIAGTLCLGVAREGNKITSYAWLERGSEVIIGEIPVPDIIRIAQFGQHP